MWKDIWQNITLVCGNHGKDESNIMELVSGANAIYYACQAADGTSGKCTCRNFLRIKQMEQMIGKMDELSGDIFSSIPLTGKKWKTGKHTYEVMEEKEGKIKVKVTLVK